jgi:Flp pilus assembly protein CpaB
VVADRLIPKGASADVLTSSGELKVADVAQNRLDAGAVASIGALQGQVATRDIYPGDQITAGDFATSSQPLLNKVQGADRAMAISLDSSHGLLGQVKPGDHVDVYSSFNAQSGGSTGASVQPVARVLMRDILVLSAPASAKAKGVGAAQDAQQDVTLRINARQAGALAFAADNGKVWFALRPKAGAKDPKGVDQVTLSRVLAGSTPIVIRGKAHPDGSFEITAKQGKGR